MKKLLIALMSVVCLQKTVAQAVNKRSLKTDCDTYELNSSKIKIRINTEIIPFGLETLHYEASEPLSIPFGSCKNRLTVTTPNTSLQAILSDKLVQAYPKINGSQIKIVITDLRVLENNLPTRNMRLYMTLDYLLKNDDGSYSKVFSDSDYYPIEQYLEKPISKILTKSITEFYRKKLYINELKSLEKNNINEGKSTLSKGLYTNFKDLFMNQPTYQQIHNVKKDETESFRAKHILRDKNGLKVSAPVLAFSDGEHNYINIEYYYSKKYFVQLSELSSRYLFIYDRIQDVHKASKNTTAGGGGLLGAALGSAAAGKKAPALIDRTTGEMKCYDRKTMKDLLADNPQLFEEYKDLLNEEKRDDLFGFLQQLIESGQIK